MATCIFCDKRPTRWSEEHITPEWLLAYLGVIPQTTFKQGFSGDEERSREFSAWRFVEGRVCEPCNTGWMSRLEKKVGPQLIELIDGTKNLAELTSGESALVAKWATKTAYVLANASLAAKPVPPAHIRSLCGDGGSIPQRVGVFALQAQHDLPLSCVQLMFWPQIIADGQQPVDPHVLDPDAYKIVLQYGHLILLVAHWPFSPGELTIAAGWHFPLWPPKIVWPAYARQRDVPPPSSMLIMRSFAETLAVWSMPTSDADVDNARP